MTYRINWTSAHYRVGNVADPEQHEISSHQTDRNDRRRGLALRVRDHPSHQPRCDEYAAGQRAGDDLLHQTTRRRYRPGIWPHLAGLQGMGANTGPIVPFWRLRPLINPLARKPSNVYGDRRSRLLVR